MFIVHETIVTASLVIYLILWQLRHPEQHSEEPGVLPGALPGGEEGLDGDVSVTARLEQLETLFQFCRLPLQAGHVSSISLHQDIRPPR